MKNLRTKIYIYGRILTFVLFILTFVSCGKETLDFIIRMLNCLSSS